MAIAPDNSEYGGQTITGTGWVHVDEDALGHAAETFSTLANKLRNDVIPHARKQMMNLSDSWEGSGSQAALDEASAIIDKHEANAKAADDAAGRLRNMEASVVKTKNAVNKNAEDVQRDCEKLNSSNLRGEVRSQRLVERIASGVAENIGVVSGNTVELSGNLNVPLETPGA
jgi:ATP/maltotriose-dependent transcriptional regulator MalT